MICRIVSAKMDAMVTVLVIIFFWANYSMFYSYRGKTIQIGQLFS